MKILKIKLQILLTGVIIYQAFGFLNQQQTQTSAYPTLVPKAMQQGSSFAAPAFASDNGGTPVDIPYNPYIGSNISDEGQMLAAAKAHAQDMVNTGDVSDYQQAIQSDPMAKFIFGQ